MVHVALDNFTFCENVGIASLDVQALCWLGRVRTRKLKDYKRKSKVCSLIARFDISYDLHRILLNFKLTLLQMKKPSLA